MPVTLATVKDLRSHVFDLLPHIEAVTSSDTVNDLLTDALATAKEELEEDLETWFEQKVIRMSTPSLGDVYDVLEAPLDYNAGVLVGKQFPMWVLRKRPVVSVQRVTFRFTQNIQVLEMPSDWWKVDLKTGTFRFLPAGSSALMMAGNASFLPLLSGYMDWFKLPQFTCIDYTAGWYDPTASDLPAGSRQISHGIMHAARLNILGHVPAILAQSSSGGGVSQSFPSWETMVKLAQQELDTFKKWWAKAYRPPRVVML